MTDDEISVAAVKRAGESIGDFVAGAHWALGQDDPVRRKLWADVYALEYARNGVLGAEGCARVADNAVRAYDRRAQP